MRLVLKDKTFLVRRATLCAEIPDPYWLRTYYPEGDPALSWGFELDAERDKRWPMWQPRVYHENLRLPVRRWIEVAGQVVEWSEPYDEESGEPNGGFYVFGHDDIPRARLCFPERRGASFRFVWEGICDAHTDEYDDSEAPFQASGWAEFSGVVVRASEFDTDKSVHDRLAMYLDVDDFTQGPLIFDDFRYESGVKGAQVVFTPIVPKEAR